MIKPFKSYEDCPILVGDLDSDPVFIFADNASISVSQSIYSKKFADDYRISFANVEEDLILEPNKEYEFILGPRKGRGTKVPESIEVIRKGSRISYPSRKSLIINKDLNPGDYRVKVIATGYTVLSYDNDIENGEVDVVRHYTAENGAVGSLNVSYYMNTGNIYSFFDVTGLIDREVYPNIYEGKITGSVGDFVFNDGYIREITFNAQPYQPVQSNVTIDIYGTLEFKGGHSENIINNNYYNYRRKQNSIPHALGTKIKGVENLGMEHPVDFTYAINVNREPAYEMPLMGNLSEDGEVPTRVNKTSIDITAEIIGEKLDPYLKITGQRAELTIGLGDIGFSESFLDNNQGELREFKLVGNLVYPEPIPEELVSYGVVDRDSISVSEGGYLRGRASIKQSYR